jgi:hypothetical protein
LAAIFWNLAILKRAVIPTLTLRTAVLKAFLIFDNSYTIDAMKISFESFNLKFFLGMG